MYKGLTQPPFKSMFQFTGYGQTRGHTLKLTKHCTNRDVRLWIFSERVINNWNLLDQTVLDACSVDVLKNVSTYLETPGWTYPQGPRPDPGTLLQVHLVRRFASP